MPGDEESSGKCYREYIGGIEQELERDSRRKSWHSQQEPQNMMVNLRKCLIGARDWRNISEGTNGKKYQMMK